MKVAFTSQPGRGHVNGLAALAQEFQRLGHEVACFGAPSVSAVFRAAGVPGFTVVPEPPGSDSEFALHFIKGLRLAAPRDRLPMIRSEMSIRLRAKCLATALLGTGALHGTDLLIHDATELAGWVTAERMHIPNMPFEVSAHWSVSDWNYACGEAICELRESVGLPCDDASPAHTIYRHGLLTNAPASFEAGEAIAGVQMTSPQFFDGDVSLNRSKRARSLGPHIFAAFGSVYRPDGRVYAAVLEALAGRWDIDAVGIDLPLISRVATFEYLPQSVSMQGCLAVLCHGGRSTVLTALSHGVPLVCAPLGSDNFIVAQAAADLGVGVEVPWVANVIAQSAAELIGSSEVRASVAQLAVEISRMPSLEEAVTNLDSRFG